MVGEMHNANPTLLLQNRFPFVCCKWPDGEEYLHTDQDQEQLAEFVRRHLMLCDFLQEVAAESARHSDEPERIFLPAMQRAVMRLFWPAAAHDEVSIGRAAIVRTGDDLGLNSGPISLESLQEYALPGYLNNDDIVHVSLRKAAEFLAELDHRETAASSKIHARHNGGAEAVRELLEEEVERRLNGDDFDEEYFQHRKRQCHDGFKMWKGFGHSDLQAALVSRLALYTLRGVRSKRVRRDALL